MPKQSSTKHARDRRVNDPIPGSEPSGLFPTARLTGPHANLLEMGLSTPPGDPIRRMLDQQQRITEMMAGGSVQRILDQQKRIDDLMAGGSAMQNFIEQQK
jgi:hypothetical protein